MSTIKSSAENLTLNADGANNDIKFQSNGSEVASIDQAGLLTATTFAGSGASLTAVGITEVDKWCLTTNLSVAAADTTLTANLARITVDSWTRLGTGVSESSGVFSFPSTGYWQIVVTSSWYKSSGDSRYLASRILSTTDNSTYAKVKEEHSNMYSGGGTYATSQMDYIFEVTNTSNDKVKFQYYAINSATLNASTANSTFTFIKLGAL